MLGGQVNKIVNTTFKWSGAAQGQTAMSNLAGGAALVATAAVAAGAALWRLSDKTTQVYGQFYDLSQRTGIAASQLHAMSIAAEQDGVGLDSITMAMRRLPSAIDDLNNGLATSVRSFDAIGLSAADLEGLSIEDQFYRVSDALIQVQDESQRAAIAQDLFGRSGMNLLPFLQRGSAGMRALADDARETGMVVGDDLYEAADQFQDQLIELKARMQGLTMEAIGPMLPRLEALAERVADIAVDSFPDLLRVMEAAVPVLDGVAWSIERIVGGLDGIAWAWGQASEGMDWFVQFAGAAVMPGMGIGETPAASAVTLSQEQGMALLGGITPASNRTTLESTLGYASGTSPFREDVTGVQAELDAARASADLLTSSLGGTAAVEEVMLKNAERHNELIEQRTRIMEQMARIEAEKQAADIEAEVTLQEKLNKSRQAALDAQLEQTQAYADMTTQIMGMAWDSMFSKTRASFGEMLRDMAAELAKSAVLGFLRKSIFGAGTGGLGFFF